MVAANEVDGGAAMEKPEPSGSRRPLPPPTWVLEYSSSVWMKLDAEKWDKRASVQREGCDDGGKGAGGGGAPPSGCRRAPPCARMAGELLPHVLLMEGGK